MTNAYKVNRRDFGKGVLALLGAAALKGCGSKDSDDSAAPPVPGLASKFTVRNFTVYDANDNPWYYGNNGTPVLDSGKRHKTTLTFYPHEDLTVGFDYVLRSADGKVDWAYSTTPNFFPNGVQATTPVIDVPVKNSMGASQTLDIMVRQGGTQDTLLRLLPQVQTGAADVANTYTVKEALDWIARRYDGNANPGVIGIVGDTAPSSDIISLSDIAQRIVADAKASYGHSSPVMQSKLASEVPVLTNSSGYIVGKAANNPRASELLGGTALPADAGYLRAYDLKNGGVYIVVSGSGDDLRVRQAARAIAMHDLHNLKSPQLKVTGTTLTDIAVEPY
jgi:hypothetical protein